MLDQPVKDVASDLRMRTSTSRLWLLWLFAILLWVVDADTARQCGRRVWGDRVKSPAYAHFFSPVLEPIPNSFKPSILNLSYKTAFVPATRDHVLCRETH